mgnify:CR=1 FL=1
MKTITVQLNADEAFIINCLLAQHSTGFQIPTSELNIKESDVLRLGRKIMDQAIEHNLMEHSPTILAILKQTRDDFYRRRDA